MGGGGYVVHDAQYVIPSIHTIQLEINHKYNHPGEGRRLTYFHAADRYEVDPCKCSYSGLCSYPKA